MPSSLLAVKGGRRVKSSLIGRQHSPCIFADHVAFDVNVLALAERAEGRVRERVLDERELHDVGRGQLVHREAHAVDGERSVRDHELRESVRKRECDEARIAARLDLSDGGDAIDVAEDEVPAEPPPGEHRALEIHATAAFPLADGGALERRGDGGYGEPVRPALADGETGTIERDALAIGEIVVATAHAQIAP